MRSENLSESRPESFGRELRSESRISESRPVEDATEAVDRDYGVPELGNQEYAMDEEPIASDSYSSREVVISPLNSGFLVKVGCQKAAVETTETLIKTLKEYFENPYEFERQWFKNQNRSKV